jgi:hypothetical protein
MGILGQMHVPPTCTPTHTPVYSLPTHLLGAKEPLSVIIGVIHTLYMYVIVAGAGRTFTNNKNKWGIIRPTT